MKGLYFSNEKLLFHRAEIINYYANLTKEATLREERAMWKIRRSVLDQARQDFLSEDEQVWRDEMEANPEVSPPPPPHTHTHIRINLHL